MQGSGKLNPANNATEITTSDSTEYAPPLRALYVGGMGAIKVTTVKGNEVTLYNCLAGTTLAHFEIKKVHATGTTATNLVGFW